MKKHEAASFSISNKAELFMPFNDCVCSYLNILQEEHLLGWS